MLLHLCEYIPPACPCTLVGLLQTAKERVWLPSMTHHTICVLCEGGGWEGGDCDIILGRSAFTINTCTCNCTPIFYNLVQMMLQGLMGTVQPSLH